MRFRLLLLGMSVITGMGRADEADAALALARARVAAEAAAKAAKKPRYNCLTSLDEAMAKARKEAKAVVCWVGLECTDRPEVRDVAPDTKAVHCHLRDWQGDKGRYLVVRPAGSEDWYRIREISPDNLRKTLAITPSKPRSYNTTAPVYQPVYALAGPVFGNACRS